MRSLSFSLHFLFLLMLYSLYSFSHQKANQRVRSFGLDGVHQIVNCPGMKHNSGRVSVNISERGQVKPFLVANLFSE